MKSIIIGILCFFSVNLYSVEYYKGEEPVGKWEYFKEGILYKEVDYSDTLVYNENKVDSELYTNSVSEFHIFSSL